ncbi:MAG TPA: bifunctional enoyl-CoA hydratase/phosphate acetyltransferase [Limnochordia bacterium]|nr:bifunctional enoyl-CoA hydratase/phosphate acetyltransferase [Limnochordia bacterium]
MGFEQLREGLKGRSAKSLVLAWGVDAGVLQACRQALDHGFLADVIVTGPPEQVQKAAEEARVSLAGFTFHPASSPAEGAAEAVRLIREGRGHVLMKGHLNTSVILRAVVNKETGIRKEPLLSHITIVELPAKRLVLLTDAAMNIKPDLPQKAQILDNAIKFAYSLGMTNPKAAVLASVETVNPQMQDTLDAAALALMGARNQFSKPAIVDGPLAFDNAYSKEAAQQKGINSPVAGEADIFLVPEITAGNILYKSMVYVGGLSVAGVITGATCPIVLTSRADSAESKLNSIAVACLSLQAD